MNKSEDIENVSAMKKKESGAADEPSNEKNDGEVTPTTVAAAKLLDIATDVNSNKEKELEENTKNLHIDDKKMLAELTEH